MAIIKNWTPEETRVAALAGSRNDTRADIESDLHELLGDAHTSYSHVASHMAYMFEIQEKCLSHIPRKFIEAVEAIGCKEAADRGRLGNERVRARKKSQGPSPLTMAKKEYRAAQAAYQLERSQGMSRDVSVATKNRMRLARAELDRCEAEAK